MLTALQQNFDDDEVEEPVAFDSNLDFWGYYFDGERNRDPDIRWHIPKDVPVKKIPEKIDDVLQDLNAKKETDQSVIQKVGFG
jgi:hypothetical protein